MLLKDVNESRQSRLIILDCEMIFSNSKNSRTHQYSAHLNADSAMGIQLETYGPHSWLGTYKGHDYAWSARDTTDCGVV